VEAVTEPIGWNVYYGSTFGEFIPNRPCLDRSEYRRRQRARVKRRRKR
jgi:hypothetical protein